MPHKPLKTPNAPFSSLDQAYVKEASARAREYLKTHGLKVNLFTPEKWPENELVRVDTAIKLRN